MKKIIFSFLILVSLFWIVVVIDYKNRSKTPKELIKIAQKTDLLFPAIKAFWYEPRVLGLEKDKNYIYPTLPTPNRFNFLYKELK